MTTKREIRDKRRNLAKLADKTVYFNKGDRRVYSPRLCVVCGRPLSNLIINENKYLTIVPHTRYHLNEFFIVDVCTDVQSCYRTLSRKGELDGDVNG